MLHKESEKALLYKDQDPTVTVCRVKAILQSLDIVLKEQWVNEGEDGVFSLRAYVPETSIGTNGKGISAELARASAYSEFLERLQNLRLSRCPLGGQKGIPFYYYIDERMLSPHELIQEESAFLDIFFRQRNIQTADSDEKLLALKKVQGLDFGFCHKEDEFLCFPFFNLSRRKVEYLPYYLYSAHYASNGMCAGNTPEEALVQGISEIIERYVQRRVMREHIILPNIADSYIKQNPFISRVLNSVEATQKYKVFMKDCSLGGIFPVCALALVEIDTGKYGVKFGCHPDYAIAMERTITEAAQGNRLVDYAKRSGLDFKNSHVDDEVNILNGYQSGVAQFPYEIFVNGDECFPPPYTARGRNNRELLGELINLISSLGHEILIRDVSWLGYPSFHVIVPGMSEALHPSDQWLHALNVKYQGMSLLNNPASINAGTVDSLIKVMEYFANTNLENNLSSYYGISGSVQSPGEEYGLGWLYFVAMGYAMQGDYTKALNRMELFINRASKVAAVDGRYLAVRYYFSAMLVFQCHIRAVKYLTNFFGQGHCEWLDETFKEKSKVFVNQYQSLDVVRKAANYDRYVRIVDSFKRRQLEQDGLTNAIAQYLKEIGVL